MTYKRLPLANLELTFCFPSGDARLLDWPKCVQLIVDQLNVRVKGDTCQLLVNDFSTTDITSRAASQVVLMDTMKHYFSYGLELTCGIPEVALHGSLEDWHKLLEKTRGIRAWASAWTGGWTSWSRCSRS